MNGCETVTVGSGTPRPFVNFPTKQVIVSIISKSTEHDILCSNIITIFEMILETLIRRTPFQSPDDSWFLARNILLNSQQWIFFAIRTNLRCPVFIYVMTFKKRGCISSWYTLMGQIAHHDLQLQRNHPHRASHDNHIDHGHIHRLRLPRNLSITLFFEK